MCLDLNLFAVTMFWIRTCVSASWCVAPCRHMPVLQFGKQVLDGFEQTSSSDGCLNMKASHDNVKIFEMPLASCSDLYMKNMGSPYLDCSLKSGTSTHELSPPHILQEHAVSAPSCSTCVSGAAASAAHWRSAAAHWRIGGSSAVAPSRSAAGCRPFRQAVRAGGG